MEGTNITDATLQLVVQKLPGIRLLDVSRCSQITEKGLLMVVEACAQLKYLGMREMTGVTDAVVSVALQLPHLVRLDLDGASRLTDGLCKRLASPARLGLFCAARRITLPRIGASLEELSVSAIPLSDACLPTLVSLCPRLLSLNLSFCPQVSDHVFSDIIDNAPLLESLTLRATPAVSDASLSLLHHLDSLLILENPQISLTAIRKLVTSEISSVKVFGADIDITILRNSLIRLPFTIHINEFETANELQTHINSRLVQECSVVATTDVSASYKLRRVTYRKNGTKRPGMAHSDSDFGNLVRELVEKKHHMYLDQNPNSQLRGADAAGPIQTNDLFLTLRMWDSATNRPKDLRDVSLPSAITLSEIKSRLAAEGVLPCAPEKLFFVEEETDLRTNILATDAMSISMCGIISGDILHLEEITDDKMDAATNQIVHSWTGNFLSSLPVMIAIQETDDSFHRRRGRLGFLPDATFKFELKLKNTWSFTKLKNRIARKIGVSHEYIRISTRVEPQAHLHGNASQLAVDVIGGNLWLLLEIDSNEMLAEKLPVVVHRFSKDGVCASVQTLLVRKNATLKALKERIFEVMRIPEEVQLISRLSSREMATDPKAAAFVRSVYIQNSLKLIQLNLHHIRVDEMDAPVSETDLIIQTVQFSGWRSGPKTHAGIVGPVRLIALPTGSKFNDIKAAIASCVSLTVDIDTMTLKLASSTSLQRSLMFDIKPKYFEDSSPVIASTLLRPLDIVCWGEQEF